MAGRSVRRLGCFAICALLALALLAPPARAAEPLFFAETGHAVAEPFAATFRALGGLDRFGYPRTEAFVESGRLVQYYQRAVLELHPEHAGTRYAVQLRLLGDELTVDNRAASQWQPDAVSAAGGRYYPETRHSIASAFVAFFDARGGLDSFGYPISEPFDLGGVTVQYLQRARLELHPENPLAYQVQLGLLGDELIARSWPAADPRLSPAAKANGDFEWGSGRITLSGISDIGRFNAGIAVERLDESVIPPGGRLDFDEVAKSWDGREDLIYKVSKGTSCEGGLVTMRGGGVCYVSTAIWRAWMTSGLKTNLRVSHSGLLDDFGAGYDAANTLIVDNDSAATLRLDVHWSGDTIVATVHADRPTDRQTTIRGPEKSASGDYLVYQDVRWLDGRTATATFRSHYCW
jgi:hypothetical protein